MNRKGIILAGGSGTRLAPLTSVLSKQLLPIYDKPMIYYPLTTLMLAGVREIAVITTPYDLPLFQRLLGTGAQWGLHIEYLPQPHPGGLAQAYIIAEDFLNHKSSVLILGDNIFYGHDLPLLLQSAMTQQSGATVFAYHVHDPERYGVVEFDNHGSAISLEEKPLVPKSHYAITGIYFYDEFASDYAHQLKPSARGELEITDLNRLYLQQQKLSVKILSRGYTWLDTGTHQSLLEASMFVNALQTRQGFKIACPEEIAYRQGWIDEAQLEKLITTVHKNDYGKYLQELLKQQVLQ